MYLFFFHCNAENLKSQTDKTEMSKFAETGIKNFVYFCKNREKIKDPKFLKVEKFDGAQIMYSWKDLEPIKDKYHFDLIEEDLSYLKSRGKTLFIQIQDLTFDPEYYAAPKYLIEESIFDGGMVYQYDDEGNPEGWVTKRWNKNVRKRFAKLLTALGRQFDGRIEGINLQETAINVDEKYDKSFTAETYRDGIMKNMRSLKKAFSKSTTLQYANFMPGEWLPWDNKEYLESIYTYGERIGVGLGSPDLMPKKKNQLNHAYKFMNQLSLTVPIAIAIQDGNYVGRTNDTSIPNAVWENLVPQLYEFSRDVLKVSYIFWAAQEPFFSTDVVPYFSEG